MHLNDQNKSGFHMFGLQRPKQDLLGTTTRDFSDITYTSATWRTPMVACDVTTVNLFLFVNFIMLRYCLEIRMQ